MLDRYNCINSSIFSPKFTKNGTNFCPLSQSTGGWAFSLIFMFQGQVMYKSDKHITCPKIKWPVTSVSKVPNLLQNNGLNGKW